MKIEWKDRVIGYDGIVGKHKLFVIKPNIANTFILYVFLPTDNTIYVKSIDLNGMKEFAQQLLDEWMGGLEG